MNIKKADHGAKELFNLLRKSIYGTKVSTLGTMVYIPAVLAGAYKFRTFRFYSPNLKPGVVILSEEANIEWPKLFDILVNILFHKFGINIVPEKMAVKTPINNDIKLDALNVFNLYLKDMDKIAKKYDLDTEESIMACLLVCATIIHNILDKFDIYVSLRIAALGFVAGCKTVPNK
jgi:hypothetical protein